MAVLQCSTIAVFLFYTLIQQTSCDFERRCGLSDRRRSPLGVCGSHLSKLMAIVCDGQYQKRAMLGTASDPDSWADHTGEQEEEEGAMSPDEKIFVSKSRALSYLQHKRSGFGDGSSVGIVCECCTYRCTITEMTQYCKAGGMGKRSWSAPTPPHAWLPTNAVHNAKTTDEGEEITESDKNSDKTEKNQKITEVILLTMFPERKTGTA
ncbi:hypothetical protein CAPTEDRAFT_221066 [Capitella teleta]|uniref:Insulin-like domain-containing protein n=1 Tax=Capitella teleta TaxID=283909 RepID=R7UIJ5_CAPTE|nr:hypothetical protein CAPTEDRAFT_221066 [Capitella teleta]|eukprot:ELU03087.1 hypothetical protein CAPTEDRAFT_221066 [Capitella teleta]